MSEQHALSDDQVRGRYCDGTHRQTGHTTDGDEFDAWLSRVRRDAAREALDGLDEGAVEQEQRQAPGDHRAEHRIARLEAQSGIRNPLQERIAEELYYDRHPEGRHRGEWPAAVYPDDVYEYRDLAAAVLPLIAAEVRAAKAEALREAAGPEWGNNNTLWSGPRVRAKITRRATEYGTGDQA